MPACRQLPARASGNAYGSTCMACSELVPVPRAEPRMPHLHMPAATMPIHPPRPAVRLPRHPAAAPTARLPHRSPPYPTTRCASPPGCLAARLSLCPPRLPPGAPTNPRRISFCIPGAALPLPCKQIVFPGPSSLCHAGKDLSPPQGASGFPYLHHRELPVSPASAAIGFRFSQSPPQEAFGFPQSPPPGATGFPCLRRGLPASPSLRRGGPPGSPVSAAGGHRVPLPPPQGLRCRRHGMARFYRFDALAN